MIFEIFCKKAERLILKRAIILSSFRLSEFPKHLNLPFIDMLKFLVFVFLLLQLFVEGSNDFFVFLQELRHAGALQLLIQHEDFVLAKMMYF